MRVLAFVVCFLVAAAGGAHAQERYVLDPAHTQVTFTVDRFGFTRIHGRFDQVAGEITLDQAHPEQSAVSATIQTGSLSAGDDTRDGHLRGERWFNVAQFPTMTFQSTSVRQTDATHAEVTGDLTLMGQTHPVTLAVTLNKLGEAPSNRRPAAGFTATGTLQRSQWGMATALGVIGDEVAITIEALAQPPAAE